MRRSRSDCEEKDGKIVELSLMSAEGSQILPCRKKRRTFLESFQTMAIKSSSGDSSGEDDSSCATGGSVAGSDDETESLGDDDDVLLSDQEKAHRAIMYKLVTGKVNNKTSSNVVTERIEQLIRLSRLKAAATATDDFDVRVRSDEVDTMEVEVESRGFLKRSNSLPQKFDRSERPPMESIAIEIPGRWGGAFTHDVDMHR